jgi:DNA-binding phage protein
MAWAKTTGLEIAAEFGQLAHADEESDTAQRLMGRRWLWAMGRAKRAYERLKADPQRWARHLEAMRHHNAQRRARMKANPELLVVLRQQEHAASARWRKRLKSDPERYEAHKERQRERLKAWRATPKGRADNQRATRAYLERINAQRPEGRGRGWSGGKAFLDLQAVVQLREQGESAIQIALRFGVTREAIYKALKRAGWQPTPQAPRAHPFDEARAILARLSERRRP